MIVETINNGLFAMATMNFSIPEDVKQRFNELFSDRNKSEIVTSLMRRAIEEEEVRRNAKGNLIERLEKIRAMASRAYTAEEIRAFRDELRK
jgi:predicted transcriptional regulator